MIYDGVSGSEFLLVWVLVFGWVWLLKLCVC